MVLTVGESKTEWECNGRCIKSVYMVLGLNKFVYLSLEYGFSPINMSKVNDYG